MVSRVDVLVCGGGLAGLCFARQLRRESPAGERPSILLAERQRRPLPEACHKVGESTVEIGTHFLAEMLGLKAYLQERHLPKNGLRFFSGPVGAPLAKRNELGPSEAPVVPSYQLDRGRLENDLRERLESDVALREGWAVDSVQIGGGEGHFRHSAILVCDDGSQEEVHARWIVDASGRRQLLQRSLGCRRPNDNAQSAAWFRVRGRVRVDELVSKDEARWHARDVDGTRWLSTVHLCGPGYWVWLIPLSTGFTSIGIVAEPELHPFEAFGKRDAAERWLRAHEPELAGRLAGLAFEDFRVQRGYSYTSTRCFSEEGWACVGEAGLFVDPLYSPGTDLIALASALSVELIGEDRQRGATDPERVDLYNRLLIGWCDELTRSLSGNTQVFAEADVFGAKLWSDYYFYWTYMAPFFFRRCYAGPVASLRAFEALRLRYTQLNQWAQRLLKAWAELKTVTLSPGRPFSPLPMFPSVLADQHLELLEERTGEETLARVTDDVAGAEALLVEILLLALRGVGRERIAALADRAGLGEWDLVIPRRRVEMDALPRRERLRVLPPLARDLERALGRWSGPLGPLVELVEASGVSMSLAAEEPRPAA